MQIRRPLVINEKLPVFATHSVSRCGGYNAFMRRMLGGAVVVLWVFQVGAQTTATDPLDPSFTPALPASFAANSSNVWLTGPLAKVMQNGGAPGSAQSITVYSTRNEIQSFQVHVQAGTSPINALNVTMSDLVNAQARTRISAASTDIVVYREAYMNVHIPTARGATFLNTTGRIPDILIPAVDPYYHQTTKAFPFTVAAGNNQSVWIDVHIPPKAAPGFYSGTVTVTDGPVVLASMPVVYAVWDWEMPSTASLASFTASSYGGFCYQVYGNPGCSTYPGAKGSADYGATLSNVDAAVQMLDNRYTLAGITNIYPGDGSFNPTNGGDSFDLTYGPLFEGKPAHVSGILQGARFTSYNLTLVPSQVNAASFRNFQSHFAARGWVVPFYWLIDEPNPGDPAVWTSLIANGNMAHSFSNPSFPTLVTTDIVTAGKYGALDAIDILAVNITALERGGDVLPQDLSLYQKWLSGNPARKFWSYLSCNTVGTCNNGFPGPQFPGEASTYPNYVIDGTPVANRVMEWLTYLHGQTGELYYYVDVCDGPGGVSSQCSYPAPSSPNPLVSNYYAGGWGDGTLMYPGSSAYAGTTIPIWLPSIRLKMIRDGMQDYEYLNAFTKLGEGAFANQQARSFITNSYTFNNDPAALEAARMALGSRLHALTLARQGGSRAPRR